MTLDPGAIAELPKFADTGEPILPYVLVWVPLDGDGFMETGAQPFKPDEGEPPLKPICMEIHGFNGNHFFLFGGPDAAKWYSEGLWWDGPMYASQKGAEEAK